MNKYPDDWANHGCAGPEERKLSGRHLVGRHRLSLYAKLTGLSGTRQANPHPFGGRHTLIGGSVVPHWVSVLPHSGQR